MSRRRSLGGSAVEYSLRQVGLESFPPAIAIVETAAPRIRGHRLVLAQNAWNVVDWGTFGRLIRPYPFRMRLRIVARRMLATLNMRRAKSVVCLTDAMASMSVLRNVRATMIPCTLPLAMVAAGCRIDGVQAPAGAEFVAREYIVVPGTITWYKNSLTAIDLATRLRKLTGRDMPVVFAGSPDESGCWEAIVAAADREGVRVAQVPCVPAEMLWLLRNAWCAVVPSALESLSFSLGEALVHSARVFAARIPAHEEIAGRLGRSPVWLDGDMSRESLDPMPRALVSEQQIVREWSALAQAIRTA